MNGDDYSNKKVLPHRRRNLVIADEAISRRLFFLIQNYKTSGLEKKEKGKN